MNNSKLTAKLYICLFGLMLGIVSACGDIQAPAPTMLPPTPTPLAFMPLPDVVRLGENLTKASIVTVGYLYVDSTGARLTDGVTFSAGDTPQPLSPSTEQIWLDNAQIGELGNTLQTTGMARLAVVVARGQIEGPGAYGPGGHYLYRFHQPQLQPLSPQETTLGGLLSNSANYRNRYVRVTGALLTRADSALLVEHLGIGGVPAPNTRQIKLQLPLRDTAMLQRLRPASDTTVRYGQVQIEALWHDNMLVPLAIVPVSGEAVER